MMTSALLAVSAVMVAPPAEKDVAAVKGAGGSGAVPGDEAAAPASGGQRRAARLQASAVPARQHRAERLRHARGFGILEVDDEHVAARPARRVELFDQLTHARETAGIVGAHQDAVRARVGHDRHPLLGIGRPRGSGRDLVG
jgi:hypothetical protein